MTWNQGSSGWRLVGSRAHRQQVLEKLVVTAHTLPPSRTTDIQQSLVFRNHVKSRPECQECDERVLSCPGQGPQWYEDGITAPPYLADDYL